MTGAEKSLLVKYRQQRKGCAEIARLLNVSANTVKSYLQRNRVLVEAAPTVQVVPERVRVQQECCRQCGTPLVQTGRSREKQFCSDKCRLQWWHAHRGSSKRAVEHICPECNRVFSTDRTQKYCSHECYILARFGRKRINEAGSGAV